MKHIYMLGAGASNNAGAPLGAELVWNYFMMYMPQIDENNKTTTNDSREAKEEFDKYGKFLKGAGQYYTELKNEYVKWYQAINNAEVYVPPTQRYWEFNDGKKYYVDELLKIARDKNDHNNVSLIKRLIFQHITEKTSRGNVLYYCKFIERLPNNSVLMTTNFDSCLVTTIEENNFSKKGELYFDCLVDFDFVDANAVDFYYKQGGQKLIKLNGSLDWLMCNKCEKLGLFVPGRDYGSQRCSMTDNCGSQLEPYIVLPHGGYGDRMRKLREIAGEELQKATHVTIIGYSFPEYDKEIANLFKDKTNEKAQVLIIDYCGDEEDKARYKKKTEERMKSIFTKQNLHVCVDGFGKYIESTLIGAGNREIRI